VETWIQAFSFEKSLSERKTLMWRKLLDLGDRYAAKSSWKDFALVKFCLFAMGLAAGTFVPKEHRKPVLAGCAAVFTATYIPLMAKLFKTALEKNEEEQ